MQRQCRAGAQLAQSATREGASSSRRRSTRASGDEGGARASGRATSSDRRWHGVDGRSRRNAASLPPRRSHSATARRCKIGEPPDERHAVTRVDMAARDRVAVGNSTTSGPHRARLGADAAADGRAARRDGATCVARRRAPSSRSSTSRAAASPDCKRSRWTQPIAAPGGCWRAKRARRRSGNMRARRDRGARPRRIGVARQSSGPGVIMARRARRSGRAAVDERRRRRDPAPLSTGRMQRREDVAGAARVLPLCARRPRRRAWCGCRLCRAPIRSSSERGTGRARTPVTQASAPGRISPAIDVQACHCLRGRHTRHAGVASTTPA